jgi:peptide/nickel transport system ATP-binding protein
VLICDEAVSSVDATGRVALLALLGRLRDRGLACLFITHDRAAARQLGDRILVMHRGRLSEGATA